MASLFLKFVIYFYSFWSVIQYTSNTTHFPQAFCTELYKYFLFDYSNKYGIIQINDYKIKCLQITLLKIEFMQIKIYQDNWVIQSKIIMLYKYEVDNENDIKIFE